MGPPRPWHRKTPPPQLLVASNRASGEVMPLGNHAYTKRVAIRPVNRSRTCAKRDVIRPINCPRVPAPNMTSHVPSVTHAKHHDGRLFVMKVMIMTPGTSYVNFLKTTTHIERGRIRASSQQSSSPVADTRPFARSRIQGRTSHSLSVTQLMRWPQPPLVGQTDQMPDIGSSKEGLSVMPPAD